MEKLEIKTIIKNGLKKNHMTQAQLASSLNIERATVNRWCVGKAIPEADTFLNVCKILNIRIDNYLFEGDDALENQLVRLFIHLNETQKEAVHEMLHHMMEMLENEVAG